MAQEKLYPIFKQPSIDEQIANCKRRLEAFPCTEFKAELEELYRKRSA